MISKPFSSKWLIVFITLISFFWLSQISSVCSIFLAGVTIQSAPFVEIKDNRFQGFCIDLLDLIRDQTGLNYSLYLVEDNSYGPGRTYDGRASGLIGDVFHRKADFAIADLTVTKIRKRYVTFTEPYLRFSFSALVRKELAKNLHTMDDLAIKSNLSIGTFVNGKTMLGMEKVRNDILNVRLLYNQMLKNSSNLVLTMDEAMKKVYNEPYAFIQEEPKNMYYSAKDCERLKTLHDQNMYVPGEYAIAFHPESPHIDSFNMAIKNIKYKGHLKRLIRKHFYNPQCRNGSFSEFRNHDFRLYPVIILAQIFIYKIFFKLTSNEIK